MIEKISKKYKLPYPKNDLDAYIKYNKYNFIYNKLELFKYQKLNCNPTPIEPDEYPVVIKPIINLQGMGIDSIIINNLEEYNNNNKSGFFWCKYLKGIHLSWDVIINNGIIIYFTVFQGYKYKEKDRFGTFKYWIQKDVKLYKIIKKLINDKFNDYTGHLNIETIGKFMIEAHLRLGDIDFCHEDIILLALLNLNKKDITIQLNKVNNNSYQPIYMMPLWTKKDTIDNYNIIYNFIYDNIEDEIIEDDMIIGYYFDRVDHPSPANYKRWLLLVSHDFTYLKNKIKKYDTMIENLIVLSYN